MSDRPISRRSGWWIALLIVGAAIVLLLAFMAGAALDRYTASGTAATSRALSATQAVAAYLTAQPPATATPLPAATATPTSIPAPTATPDAAATATTGAKSIAEAVSATLSALPTATATPVPTDTPLPTSTPTSTPLPDAAATARAELAALGDAVAQTLTAQPADTSTPTLTPTATADAAATRKAELAALADAVAQTLTAQPADTNTPTLTLTATADAAATRKAELATVEAAVAQTLTAQPADTSTPTLTLTATPDAAATRKAELATVEAAVAQTLTAQPADTPTPTLTPTGTPDAGATRRAYLRDLTLAVAAALTAMPTQTPTLTLTATQGPDLKATEQARRHAIDGAVALTLTAQPAPRCAPLLALPTLTLWIGRTETPPEGPLVVPTDTPTDTLTEGCTDGAEFVADVTVPDGTEVAASVPFEKTWRLRNAGTCAWMRGYQLQFASGERLGGTAAVPLPFAPPGAIVDVTVPLVAPEQPGDYRGIWQPANAGGVPFGPGLVVAINVAAAEQPQTGARIEFRADAAVVDAGDCTALHWNVEGVRDVHLDGDGVVGAGSRTVCPCEDETHVLRITTRDGATEERRVTVDVRGSCEEAEEPEQPDALAVEFRAGTNALQAGKCTELSWHVSGVKAVYLDDAAVIGDGTQQVCPCESATYTLTVVYLDDSSRDYKQHIKVSGSCRSLVPGGLLRPLTPAVPPLHLFIVPTPTLPTVE